MYLYHESHLFFKPTVLGFDYAEKMCLLDLLSFIFLLGSYIQTFSHANTLLLTAIAHSYTHAHFIIHLLAHTWTSKHTHTHTHTHTNTFAHSHKHTHTLTRSHTHTHTHTPTFTFTPPESLRSVISERQTFVCLTHLMQGGGRREDYNNKKIAFWKIKVLFKIKTNIVRLLKWLSMSIRLKYNDAVMLQLILSHRPIKRHEQIKYHSMLCSQ